MPAELIVMGIALSAVALDGWLDSAERTYRQQKIQDRIAYSENAIYSLFYADSEIPRDVILDSWRQVARMLHVDYGRLRPGDRLIGFLGFYTKLRSSRSDIDRLLEMVCGKLAARHAPRPDRLRTIDDVVRCLALLELSRHQSPIRADSQSIDRRQTAGRTDRECLEYGPRRGRQEALQCPDFTGS